jgi:hypothetical protein
MAFIVVYDADVLYGNTLRDLLIRIAQLPHLVQAKWTDQILDEMVRSLQKNRPDISDAKASRLRDLMNAAVRDCLVTGYEPLIASLELPDPDDRHVGGDHLSALGADDRGGGRGVQAAGEHPRPGRLELVVEGVDRLVRLLHVRLGGRGLSFDGVHGEQILRHLGSPFAGAGPGRSLNPVHEQGRQNRHLAQKVLRREEQARKGCCRCQALGRAGLTWTIPPSTIRVSNAGCRAVAGPCTTAPSASRKVLPCHGQVTHGSPPSPVSVP